MVYVGQRASAGDCFTSGRFENVGKVVEGCLHRKDSRWCKGLKLKLWRYYVGRRSEYEATLEIIVFSALLINRRDVAMKLVKKTVNSGRCMIHT